MKNQITRVDETYFNLIEELGESELLNAIFKALNYDTLEDTLAYICRMYDIGTECKEK